MYRRDEDRGQANGRATPVNDDRDVQRLHIRSTVEGVSHDAATTWCLTNGYAGVGWGLWDPARSGISWEEYMAETDGLNSNVRRFHDLATGTLLWTRERNGIYWLGVVEGEWEYHDDDTAHALDMFNLRGTAWRQVGAEDLVPGRVVNGFRSSRTLQRIGDRGARAYSRRMHQQVAEHRADLEPVAPRAVIESLIGSEDLEDLVAVYLQDRFDYLAVSRLRSTPGYEYVLSRRTDGSRAVVSVKSGQTPVDLDLLPSDTVDASYAYAVSGQYVGERHPNLTCIKTEELTEFIVERRAVLPERVVAWLR
jgi:hypothetical protein